MSPGCDDLFSCLVVPFSERDSGVVVVRSDEYGYRVEIVAMFGIKIFCLFRDVIPLAPVYSIDKRMDSKPFLEIAPLVVVLDPGPVVVPGDLTRGAGYNPGIGNGVSEKRNPRSLPRMDEGLLGEEDGGKER